MFSTCEDNDEDDVDDRRRLLSFRLTASFIRKITKQHFEPHYWAIRGNTSVLSESFNAKERFSSLMFLILSRAHPTVYAKTSHFKNSFILHGLNKFQ